MRTLGLVAVAALGVGCATDDSADGGGALAEAVASLDGEVDALSGASAALGARLDEVDAALLALQARVLAVEDAVSALGGDPRACPEEMVPVGDVCVDRWKASVWDNAACDGTGTAYGVDAPDFPATFPESGDWTVPLYACSLEGVVPAGNLTWFQAAQACALSGKSLCTNAQWQTAVAGTPSDVDACALESGVPVPTGSYPACVSRWGTYDQVGIRWEWTAEWSSDGATWMEPSDEDRGRQTPWPGSYGDGADYTLNVNGESMGAGTMTPGLPAATIRGGDYSNGQEGGSFALSRARAPSHLAPFVGFRCCQAR